MVQALKLMVTSFLLRWRTRRYRRRGWESYTFQYRRPPQYATDEEWKAVLIEQMRKALANTTFIRPLEVPPSAATFKEWTQYR